MPTMKMSEKSKIEIADQKYVNAVFDALMNFQAIEALIKKCITMSYEIIACSCSSNTTFTPSESSIEAIENRLGLGALVEKFKEVTPHKKLCERIKSVSKIRNNLAHSAAADHMKFSISLSGANKCHLKASEFEQVTEQVNKLYYELMDIYNELEEEHGQKI
jgi:hypothetical protein